MIKLLTIVIEVSDFVPFSNQNISKQKSYELDMIAFQLMSNKALLRFALFDRAIFIYSKLASTRK